MNYYRPRQLRNPDGKPSGIWHFTCMNDGFIWPIGYCAKKKCRHKTPLAASNCYRKYIKEECKGMYPGGFPMKNENRKEELIITSSY